MAEEKGITLTMDDLKKLLGELQKENSKSLIEAIKELKAPTPEQIEAKAKADEAKKRQMEAMLEVAKAEEAGRKAEQAACSHIRGDGTYRIGGQVFNDKKVRLFCLMCQKLIIERDATPDDDRNGPLELIPDNFKVVTARLNRKFQRSA